MGKILVISPTPTHPQDAGNRARIFVLCSELQKIGHTIHFLFLDKAVEKSDIQAMEKKWNNFWRISWHQPSVPWVKRWYDFFSRILKKNTVLPYKIDDWFDDSIIPFVRKISDSLNPNVIIVEYVYVSKILDLFGKDILKILDTHDVFGGRDQLFFHANNRPLWFYTTEEEEKKGIERADLILAIQSQEAEYFKKLSNKKVLSIGYFINSVDLGDPKPMFAPKLLFVGSSNPSNLDGMKWFLENVFRIIQKKLPGTELDVVGNVGDFIEPAPGLNIFGAVENLTPFYKNALVVINPLQFGTGLKIKSIEALAMKRPLVTTSNGATGIEDWSDRAFLCADKPEEFAAAILEIISSKKLRDTLKKGAEEFILLYNQNALNPLSEAIDTFLNTKRRSCNTQNN